MGDGVGEDGGGGGRVGRVGGMGGMGGQDPVVVEEDFGEEGACVVG